MQETVRTAAHSMCASVSNSSAPRPKTVPTPAGWTTLLAWQDKPRLPGFCRQQRQPRVQLQLLARPCCATTLVMHHTHQAATGPAARLLPLHQLRSSVHKLRGVQVTTIPNNTTATAIINATTLENTTLGMPKHKAAGGMRIHNTRRHAYSQKSATKEHKPKVLFSASIRAVPG